MGKTEYAPGNIRKQVVVVGTCSPFAYETWVLEGKMWLGILRDGATLPQVAEALAGKRMANRLWETLNANERRHYRRQSLDGFDTVADVALFDRTGVRRRQFYSVIEVTPATMAHNNL